MPTPRIPHALYRGLIAARLPDWLAKASADDLERLHALSARAQASRQALEDAAKALPRYDAYATTALNTYWSMPVKPGPSLAQRYCTG